MSDDRFDVLIIGAGPAGSTAALVLARGGARVALVDKATFPRSKACGDLIGPRGLQVLDDLSVVLPAALPVGDMVVVGPTGRRVRLPSVAGLTYPGHAVAVPRLQFDEALRCAAIEAGAVPFHGHAIARLDEGAAGFALDDGTRLRADFVIGADGANSRVADASGLVDRSRVMWGFAIRGYLEQVVDLPYIVLWETAPWRALPGYGWLFPGPDGRANVGVGVGTLTDRSSAATATQLLPAFLAHLARLELIEWPGSPVTSARLGGWLKMGMIGTVPAADRVLLVGDAAGLVNPLQGEGISQALSSGRAAAEAILARPSDAAARYTGRLAAEHLPYLSVAAAMQGALLPRPRAIAGVGRALTAPGVGRALAGGWSIFWNELLDGAAPGSARSVAAAATAIGSAVTARSGVRRWFDDTLR